MYILAIIGDFYSKPSSVANCSKQLLLMLREQGHKIHVVTNNGSSNSIIRTRSDNFDITCIPDRYVYDLQKKFTKIEGKFMNRNKIARYLKLVTKVFVFARYHLFGQEHGLGGWSISDTVDECIDLNQRESFDMILSISQPFTTHLIAKKLKQEIAMRCTWIMYEFDPYLHNACLSQSAFAKASRSRRENAVFGSSDKILVTQELYDLYQVVYSEYLWKMIVIPYTFLQDYSDIDPIMVEAKKKISFIYAGGFYKDIRNPLFSLAFLKNLDIDFEFTIFSNYSDTVFLNFIGQNSNKFRLEKIIDQSKAISYMKSSDFLISIGNTIQMQIPAKIFEYISIGKPIIHFSKIANDPAINYLKYYPMVYIVYEYNRNERQQLQELKIFIEKYVGTIPNKKELEKIHYDLGKSNVYRKLLSVFGENL